MFTKVPSLSELGPKALKRDVLQALAACNVHIERNERDGCGTPECSICERGIPHGCGSESCPRCGVFLCFQADGQWTPDAYITQEHKQEWIDR
jgi:hypothetical protein